MATIFGSSDSHSQYFRLKIARSFKVAEERLLGAEEIKGNWKVIGLLECNPRGSKNTRYLQGICN